MRIPYLFTEVDGVKSLTLVLDGQHSTISGEHPRFDDILAAVTALNTLTLLPEDERARSVERLTKMVNAGQEAVDTMRALSERVSYLNGAIYFDGDPIEGPLADHIAQMVRTGDDTWSAPVKFLENLATNPAKHVRRRLWEWISDRGLTLTAEGLVVGYKGVRNDETNSSITAGRNTVWVDGVEHTGNIPNPIGATLVMSRAEVDNDRDAECSQGLHVGTWDYAYSFGGGHVLTVTFNPRDVIAIPRGEGHAKIRVCRYTVQEVSHAKNESTTYAAPYSAPDEDEDSDEDDLL